MATARITNWGRSKIVAIKYVRQLSGIGLREAKDTVEQGTWFSYAETSANRALK